MGQASYSDVITAMQWIADNVQYPAVVSASIAGNYSAAVNQAVTSLMNDFGITVVAAAGNSNEDACGWSPAGVPGVVAVGAVDSQMRRWGNCTTMHAPGVDILSAGLASDTASAVMTGTSMSAPHAAGVAALYMQNNPGASPADVRAQLVASATPHLMQDDAALADSLNGSVTYEINISSTPNLLLYSMLNDQGVILPSVINITSSLAALTFSLSLSAAPGQDVQVSIQSPTAAWNPSQALALISPGSLLFEGVTWNTPQQVSVSPAAVSVGDFFLSLTYRSADNFYNGAFQTVRVNNNQTLTGETAASPRAISSLPFAVTDSISKFADNYTQPCPNVIAPGRAGPEVVYAYTPLTSTYVDISTCNSTFTAAIYVFTNPDVATAFSCTNSNITCSSSDAIGWSYGMTNLRLFGSITYYIVVEGPFEAVGDYMMSVSESAVLQSA
ncbi:MAG: peptidase S8 and S53 subtilisin kexin sedolisin [Trebouxia sp. A1-2]|nr:MAG: peptidase S8 and S53 subtilisin kexin sedolisin [Trebouxia sp. A1-2]